MPTSKPVPGRIRPLHVAAATMVALLMFAYRYLNEVAEGEPANFLDPLICEFTGVFGAALFFPLIARLVRRFRPGRAHWYRLLPLHGAALLVFSVSSWEKRSSRSRARTMQISGAQEVTLTEELQVLDLYLDIMRARFQDRLDIALDVSDDARNALVPTLVLQPLVENAFRHGAPPPPAAARIDVRAHRENGALLLEVRDNGPGMAPMAIATAIASTTATTPGSTTPTRGGVGLANTRARLEQLYGSDQALELENAAGGGLRVRVRLPFRAAAVPAPAEEATPWSA